MQRRFLQLFFIARLEITINLIRMASIENRTDSTSRKMLPHFKSTNCFDTASHSKGMKIRRDLSTVSNYYLPTDRKNSDHLALTARPDSKSLLDTLPDINSKHRAQKRSGFLEMWLEEALDPQEGKGKVEGHIEVEKTGPLRTVQKFEIDKKYLKSQNISGEVVDKLYNSLYVYTYGINNTFTELLSLTKASEHAERKIVNSFWRAFIKLLEGCTSYRTAFQVIEESYRKQADELREGFAAREASFLEERKHFEAEVVRLSKRISEQSNTISKLTSDYNIAESTLHLTDQAFNQEVSLRLKFEEKVNAVFSSYEEIRIKYQRLLNDLRIRGEEEVVSRQMQISLRSQLEQMEIRNIELARQLARMEEVVTERDRQIEIKRQEIFELTGTLAEINERHDDNEENVRKIVLKLDHFRQENERLLNEMAIRNTQISELSQRTIDQQNIIDATRNANERVYEKYETTGKLLGDFNAERVMLESQAQQALAEAATANQIKEEALKKMRELEDQVSSLEYQVKILQQDKADKACCIEKNEELIRDLQAVKDKFQRMYNITAMEKSKMEAMMNEAVQLKERFEEEITGMRMLLENRGTELDQANNKLDNQRDVFRSKITSLREEINAKEQQILDFHNRQLEDQGLVAKAVERMKTAETEINALTEEKLRLQAEIAQKDRLLSEGILERHKNTELFKELSIKLQEISMQQQSCQLNLSNKTSVLEQMRGRADKQKDLLRRLLESYREDREKKVSFVHPMIYEDCRMQIDRNTIKIASLNGINAQLHQNIEVLNQNIQELQSTIAMLRNSLLKSEADNSKKKQTIHILENSKKELQKEIAHLKHEKSQNQAKNSERSAKYEKNIDEQQNQLKRMNEQLEYKKKVIKTQNDTIDKLQDQKKIQNIHYRAQEEEISNMKVEITRLKEQLSASRRTDSKNSVRTQMLKRKSTLKDQERETGSKGQEREHLDSSKQSNHQQTYRSEDNPLKPIEEEERKREQSPERVNHVQVQAKEKADQPEKERKNEKIEVRPSTVERQMQTQKEKEKPKFSHSFKFEQVRPTVESYGCQVDLLSHTTHNASSSNSPVVASHSLHKPRIESEEFKRALKLTYMRR